MLKHKQIIVFLALSLVLTACSSSGNADTANAASNNLTTDQSSIVNTQSEAISAQLPDVAGTPDEICSSLTPASEPETRDFNAPEPVLSENTDYRAIFCTDAGAVYVDLFEQATPLTVNNFVFLAINDFYNNTMFHRVIADFMVQGGDPEGTGRGGPNYRFEDEFVGYLHFDRMGLLAMANSGPNTNGSQFFITTSLPTHLNYAHTIFGEVIQGQEIVEAIEIRDPQTATEPGTALNTVVIIDEPENVDATVVIPDRAEREDAESIFSDIPELAPGLVVDETNSGVVDTATYVDSLPESEQDTLDALLTENNHQYVLQLVHDNVNCVLNEIAFAQIGFELHAFESVTDAQNFVTDERMTGLVNLNGDGNNVSSEVLPNDVYIESTEVCDVSTVSARTYDQIGRYVTISEVTLPSEREEEVDLWLDQVINNRIYQNILSEILRPEMWYDD